MSQKDGIQEEEVFEFQSKVWKADILAETQHRDLAKQRAQGKRQSFARDAGAVEEEDRAECTAPPPRPGRWQTLSPGLSTNKYVQGMMTQDQEAGFF